MELCLRLQGLEGGALDLIVGGEEREGEKVVTVNPGTSQPCVKRAGTGRRANWNPDMGRDRLMAGEARKRIMSIGNGA